MRPELIPKVMLGTSPFIGAGQFGMRSFLYYAQLYENPKNMEKIILKSYELGVRGIQALPYERILNAIKNVERKIGEKFIIIATICSEEDFEKFNEFDVMAMILHASIVDGKNKEITKILNHIDYLGFKSGIATHAPFSILNWLLKINIHFDVMMIPFNKIGKFMDAKPEIIIELAKKFNKPIIGKKVLAAGSLKPREALEYASKFLNAVALGIASEKEAIETFKIALEFFK
ncbi:MAG: hypothetical protein NZ922_05415 [Candidatus Methanomethyliaceae archaeon]|nr:hypothetical protein [Candidatus Methanomethyliaceae archaeon]MDW7971415.1 hypothetical protein [Nitrososphaerota archaeon]